MAPGVHKYCIVGYCLLIISSFLDFQMVTSSTKQFLLKIELSIVELHSSEYFIVELHSSEYSFQWEAQTLLLIPEKKSIIEMCYGPSFPYF